MDGRFFKLWAPRSHHYRHHHHHQHQYDGRSMYRPRHRYEQPFMYDGGMDMRRQRRHRNRGGGDVRGRRPRNSNFTKEMLDLHNYYRARHCAGPLTISERLNQIAQSYAEHLAATSTFEHSGNKLGEESLGENLYMQWISEGRVDASPKAAMKSWYDEVSMHNFDRPKFSKETGHFTQLVWKGTRKLGVGVAFSPDQREVYVVTNYYPAGNIVGPGYFEKNVLPGDC